MVCGCVYVCCVCACACVCSYSGVCEILVEGGTVFAHRIVGHHKQVVHERVL